MADITLTRGITLPNSANKSDFHNLIDQATGAIANIANTDMVSGSGVILKQTATPSNTDCLWLDTNATPAILKGYDGSGWVQLPGLISSLAQGDILYHNGTRFVRLAAGTAGQSLTTGGAGANPAYAGMTTQGDVEYHNGTTRTRLAPGTSGQFLKTLGAGANPAWADVATLVQSGSPSAASSVTISSLVAGARYRLFFDYLQNTSAGNLALTFNGDTGSNYRYSSTGLNPGGAAFNGSSSTTSILMTPTGTIDAAEKVGFKIDFMPPYNTNNSSFVFGMGNVNSGATIGTSVFSGLYAGAAAISSITFTPSAGTVTGGWSLYRIL